MRVIHALTIMLTLWSNTESYVKATAHGNREAFLSVANMEEKHNSVQRRSVGNYYVKSFYLWTPEEPIPEKLDPNDPMSVVKSSIKARKTFIIIHGYLGFGTEEWITSLKDKFLQTDCNVISVDWPADAILQDYLTVYRRVWYVAQDLKHFVAKLMIEKNVDISEIHVIGHSLGAHIAGLSAKDLSVKYGWITGLDPAGYMYRGVKASYRLDKSDADFVDVIHTNGCYNPWNLLFSCFGINENIGHADFWPNGGETQPACASGHEGVMCHQMMSYKYFIESIDYGLNGTYFLSRNCSDWKTFNSGNCTCGNYAQYMGFYVNKRVPGRFFLNTRDISPYAKKDDDCLSSVAVRNRRILIGYLSALGILIVLVLLVGIIMVLKKKWSGVANTPVILTVSPSNDDCNLESNECEENLPILTVKNELDEVHENLIKITVDNEENE